MSNDGQAVTAPTTPSGRYRLRTHELAPVQLPRARASSSSTPDGTKAKAEEPPTAIAPARPRVSITGVGATPRGRAVLESVAFDPFSQSESFKLLLQNPEASSKRREDPAAVSEFRQWLLQHFPHLARTLQSLSMISAQTTRLQEALLPDAVTLCIEPVNQFSGSQDRLDELDEEDEGKREPDRNKEEDKVDSDESWRLMLRYATVRSAVPGEVIGSQNVTRSTCVYFLLNGHCTLSFRPMLLRDAKVPSTPSSLTRMHATMLGCCDRPVVQLRELVAGDCFGFDAAAFGFNYLLTTATAGAARQRNFLGLREVALTYVLCLPYQVAQQLQMLQRRRQVGTARLPPAFPYSFAPEAELFLRNTFLFQAMADSSRRILAAHLRPVVVARQEYLFTPGQPVQVFIVITGQLTLGSPREEHAGRREEADLELELLQSHDSVGLTETLQMATSFTRYCVVTSASGVRAYSLSPTVLLMVLTQEPSSLKLIHEWITSRKSWFELRRATALAQRKKHTAVGSEHVVRLTLAAQRRSKLACSRCGWAGHSSTSASCVRVEASGNNITASPMLNTSRRGGRSREDSQAGNEQDEGPRTAHRAERSEFTPVRQPLPPNSPTSPPRTPAHRKLQVDFMALRALQISKITTAQSVHSNESFGRGVNSQEDLYSNTDHNGKDNDLRSCALTQSLQRLEMALAHDITSPGRQGRK